jgi:hypothetical protein
MAIRMRRLRHCGSAAWCGERVLPPYRCNCYENSDAPTPATGMPDGRRMALRFHLFTADELRRSFAEQFEVEDLCGLDIFHGRFSPIARWHPAAIGADPRFLNLPRATGGAMDAQSQLHGARDTPHARWASAPDCLS